MQLKLIILLLLFSTVGYSQSMYLFNRDTTAFTGPPADDSLVFMNMAHQLAYVSVGTLASDGDKVYKWVNVGTQSNQFYQGTSASRPNLRTNQINGYPALEFRYAQTMADTLAGLTPDQGMLFIVMKLDHDSTTTVRRIFSAIPNAARPRLQVNASEVEVFFSTAGSLIGSGSINGKWVLLTVRMGSATTALIREDGTQTISGTKTSGQKWTGVGVTIGADAAAFSRFYVAEVILTAGVNTTLRNDYEEYLRNKYNLY